MPAYWISRCVINDPVAYKRYTDQVEVTDWPGFGPQKNRALAKARCDWVLSIDADEEVTPALVDRKSVV